MPLAEFTARTVQVVGRSTVSDVPVELQPTPETRREIDRTPEPPVVVTVMGVPATPVNEELEMANGDWATPLNVKATDALDSLAYSPLAARMAVTVHVVGCDALKDMPEALQPVPDTESDSAPPPVPPAAVTTIGVPADSVVSVLVMYSAACAWPAKVKETAALVALA